MRQRDDGEHDSDDDRSGGSPSSRTFRARPRRGDVIEGRYLLDRLLGEGGMGEVWAARHLALDRPVALKIVLIDAPVTRERLLQEARALATLRHPTIVEVFDFGELRGGTPYIVMELLEGESLEARLRRDGPLDAEDAVRLIVPLLDGLDLAHRRGIVHRDLKPANVFVERTTGLARLLDFGIAFIARSDAARITTSGGIVGTPSYMSPEQFSGRAADARTDVWGVGVMLYELMTGELPFGGGDPFAVMAKVLGRTLVRPDKARGLDEELWAIIARSLAKSEADRFPSATALGAALTSWLGGRVRAASYAPTLASVPPPAPRTPAKALPRESFTMFAGRHGALDDDGVPSLDAMIRAKLAGA